MLCQTSILLTIRDDVMSVTSLWEADMFLTILSLRKIFNYLFMITSFGSSPSSWLGLTCLEKKSFLFNSFFFRMVPSSFQWLTDLFQSRRHHSGEGAGLRPDLYASDPLVSMELCSARLNMRQALFGLRGASREPSSPPAGEEPPLVPTGAILRRREAMMGS